MAAFCCAYLLFCEPGPEPRLGTLVGVGRHDGVAALPGLVDVLDDDGGLRDGVAVVDEHGHLLGHRVVAEQVGALVGEVLVDVLVLDALQPERPLHSDHHRARPHPQHLHALLGHCWRLEPCLCSCCNYNR